MESNLSRSRRRVTLFSGIGSIILLFGFALVLSFGASPVLAESDCPVVNTEAGPPDLPDGCEYESIDWDWKFINLCFDVDIRCEFDDIEILIHLEDWNCVFE